MQHNKDGILTELASIAFERGDRDIKTTEKLKALELLGKHYNLWAGNAQISDECMAKLDAILEKMGVAT
jgi:hypothetical protein